MLYHDQGRNMCFQEIDFFFFFTCFGSLQRYSGSVITPTALCIVICSPSAKGGIHNFLRFHRFIAFLSVLYWVVVSHISILRSMVCILMQDYRVNSILSGGSEPPFHTALQKRNTHTPIQCSRSLQKNPVSAPVIVLIYITGMASCLEHMPGATPLPTDEVKNQTKPPACKVRLPHSS